MSKWFYEIKRNGYLPLIIGAGVIGFLCASWNHIYANESTESIMAASVFVLVISFAFTSYLNVEISLENRHLNQNKLLCEYSVRFSSDYNIANVAKWLLAISDINRQGQITHIYLYKDKDDKGNLIKKPSAFEIDRFLSFFTELNILIRDKQIKYEDANKLFSIYALLFNKVKNQDNDPICYNIDSSGLSLFIENPILKSKSR